MDDRPDVKPELLVLVEDCLPPLKMIVTWPKAHFDYGAALVEKRPGDLEADDAFSMAWARIAGIDVDEVEKWSPVLFENGLLFEAGTVSDTAEGYVKSRGLVILSGVVG